MDKRWFQSRGKLAGILLILLTAGIFLGAWLVDGQPMEQAAATTGKVMAVLGPVLAGLGIFGIRAAVSVLLAATLAVAAGCSTPGGPGGRSGAGGGSAAGGYVVGGEQEAAAGTSIAVGGNTTVTITPKPGVIVPPEVTAAVVEVLRSEVPVEAKERVLAQLSKLYGFSIDVTVTDSGNADNAGSAGRSNVPPTNEPDKPEIPDGG